MKRGLVLTLFLALDCTGCLYYAYPTISHVPELTVENKDLSVHAFRVDIDLTERKPDPTITQYTFARIPVDQHGMIPSQLEIAPATGVYNPLRVVEGPENERSLFTLNVRLYRPRYCTQEIKSWDKMRNLQWIAAPDLLSQEKAVDDLIEAPSSPDALKKASWWDRRDEKTPGLGLQPGLTTNHLHREVLIFAADEYLRLANDRAASLPTMDAVRNRLRSKSQWLRTFADRSPAETR